MKKLIAILIITLMFLIGCVTMTDQEAKETWEKFDKFPHKILVP